jgi:GNAT superfamily N-acetyltransferase
MTLSDSMRIRDAAATESPALEALQRRSSDVWEQYRDQLTEHPDAIELAPTLADRGWVRVAALDDGRPLGFSVVIPREGAMHELDGLFVEPDRMQQGIGRLLVEDACRRARAAGAQVLEVIAGPAQAFYERLGFRVVAIAETRFGPAVRMRRDLLAEVEQVV